MDKGLLTFFSTTNNSSGINTHYSNYLPKDGFTVQFHKKQEFWILYCDLVYINTDVYLSEEPSDCTPLIVDMIYKFENPPDNIELIDTEFIKNICRIYQEILRENYIISETNEELIVYYLKTESYICDNYICYNIRLQFPYAPLEKNNYKNIILPKSIQKIRRSNSLGLLPVSPIGDIRDIILDEPIGNTLMYGSKLNPNSRRFEFINIWKYIENIHDDNDINPTDLASLHIQNLKKNQISLTTYNKYNKFLYWLPLYLSINYTSIPLTPNEVINQSYDFTSSTSINSTIQLSASDELNDILSLLDLLNNDRFTSKFYQEDIGSAIYHSDNGGQLGLEKWIYVLSKKLNDESIGDMCKEMYQSFNNKNITIKTIAWYARDDSPLLYSDWHNKWYTKDLNKAFELTDYDIAAAFYKIYWLDYIYYSHNKNDIWYKFKLSKWEEDQKGIELTSEMSNNFYTIITEILTKLTTELNRNRNGEPDSLQKTIKNGLYLTRKLKSNTFKSLILKELRIFFRCEQFQYLLDSNHNILGVSNGVLEINNENILFRNTKPEDYISLNTKIPYDNNLSINSPIIIDCLDWINKIFIDTDLKHYFLKFSSSCLKGKNAEKKFMIWSGSGDNSKSMLVKLFEYTLGDYVIKLPISLISEKATSSYGPSPQLARAKNKRIAFMDEPEDDISLNRGIIKKLTGGDTYYARNLYDNGEDIKSSFKLVLTCNNIPVITNPDKAIKNRLHIMPFNSTWIDNPPSSIDEQFKVKLFKKNTNFESAIPYLAQGFLWLIVNNYSTYYNENLKNINLIIKNTNYYWLKNDVYHIFISENILIHTSNQDDKNIFVKVKDIYLTFKGWFKESYPNCKIPDKNVFTQFLAEKWGEPVNQKWYGYTLISTTNNQVY